MGFMSTGQAQEVLQMEPVKVEGTLEEENALFSMKLDPASNSLSFLIEGVPDRKFHSNPLQFAQKQFDVQKLIKDNDAKYDGYLVVFECDHGKLDVNYDDDGGIDRTHQSFRDLPLPDGVSEAVLKQYDGWQVLDNKYVLNSRNGEVKKEFYKIKLQNGNKNKSVKINVERPRSIFGLAVN